MRVRGMMKLRFKKASMSNGYNGSKFNGGDIEWELRPGGMLVQKRSNSLERNVGDVITVKISTGSQLHDVSILATSTFGELKVMLSVLTCLEPREQRLLFKGKEREDTDHLHMVGVKDLDKILLFEGPAYIEKKLLGMSANTAEVTQLNNPISV